MEATKKIPTANEIRKDFIDFFVNKGHEYVPSSSTVPHDDPTLLFSNAGMNQFKNIFLGRINPDSSFGRMKRACNSQKCIRAGGKHNDLDDVGKDGYHHTFFEMLGNWSFNDYFKKEAITYAWELLTGVWGLPKDRFYVTYFSGTKEVPIDSECVEIWTSLGISKDRILPFGMKENFWEMGEVGPCGPCSEIHFDRVGNRNAAHLVNMDDPDVIEIWNLVFIQYNRESDSSLVRLPAVHVDTGMGFERIVSVIQNTPSNYDTDVFGVYFKKIQELTGNPEYKSEFGAGSDPVYMAYRVVADHIRTLTIAIADGCRPDNIGRGYVIRRILRRAIRFASEKLGMSPGMLSMLVEVTAAQLGHIFPEIITNKTTIKSIIDQEESQFLNTLQKGRTQLNKAIASSDAQSHSNIISGKLAWVLYETYGFPLDLTQLMACERGFSVDVDEYNMLKERFRIISQQSATFKGVNSMIDTIDIEHLKSIKVAYTDFSAKYDYQYKESYVFDAVESTITAIKTADGFVDKVSDAENVIIFMDRTNFYAEEGGQQADRGVIKCGSTAEFLVKDVQVSNGYYAHQGVVVGEISVGSNVVCHVDGSRRVLLMNNHTATHVLNFALRQVLYNTDQRGSLVSPHKLRFDFSCDTTLTDDNIREVQLLARQIIKESHTIYTSSLKLADALKVDGVRAVFGETYPDTVRIVSIGVPLETAVSLSKAGFQYSIELCGGLHVFNTCHMIDFVITSDESIGKGIRRIVCITGDEAVSALALEDMWKNVVEGLESESKSCLSKFNRSDANALISKIVQVSQEIGESVFSISSKNEFKRRLQDIKSSLFHQCNKEMNQIVKELSERISTINLSEGAVFVGIVDVSDSRLLESTAKNKKIPLFILCKDDREKVNFLCVIPKNVSNPKISAKEWTEFVCSRTKSKTYGNEYTCRGVIESFSPEQVKKFAQEYIFQLNKNLKIVE